MIELFQKFLDLFQPLYSAAPVRTSARPETSPISGAPSIEPSFSPANLASSSNVVNREAFFTQIRSTVFHNRLNQDQVDNLNTLLDTWEILLPNADPRWIANSLAQIHHETGGRMTPIRETFAESDWQAVDRLERAWRNGKLPWVRKPYWHDGWFGRGHIQLTHQANYRKMAERTGYPLVDRPSLMLAPKVSAEVAVIGMVEGLFTGQKLADYFNETTDDPLNARRIVNGPDGTDAKVAALHHQFLKALA